MAHELTAPLKTTIYSKIFSNFLIDLYSPDEIISRSVLPKSPKTSAWAALTDVLIDLRGGNDFKALVSVS